MALSHPSWTVDTTFSGKSIATAASVYTFTAGAAAKIKITVKLTNAAGNGDYVVYLQHQWLGTGTAAVLLPKTTCPATSGETVIQFMSMELDVKATDVVDIMINGLAGDTSVSGAIRISADNPSVFDVGQDMQEMADAILLRDWTEIVDTIPSRSVLNALRFLRNKWAASGGTLTVYEENDATPAWQAALTTNLGADRITGVTPE